MLRRSLTPAQERIAYLLTTPPYKVLVRAGHNVGKSFLAACVVNWWYDAFDPGVCLTTAPTDRQVKDILWKEVRTLRGKRGGFPGPKACRLESTPGHFAHGFTARDGHRFQGQHSPAVLIVFDEAEGVDPIFWEAAETMLAGDHYAFLAIYNPTSQSSPTVEAERSGRYHLVTMSALDHPNIAAELAGEPPPYPSAIRLGRLREMLQQWGERIEPGEAGPRDINLGGQWYRPGPVAQARLLGIRPDLAFNAVWAEAVFERACLAVLPLAGPLQIGCDVARFGDDQTVMHVRLGGSSVHHEAHNGWTVVQTAQRLKQLAFEWGKKQGIDPQRVLVAVDDCGVGGGVTDIGRADRYCFVGVNAAAEAPDKLEYPNLRSALCFGLAEEAARGNVSFARLTEAVRQDLRRELTAPTYTLDVRGRRRVESKDETKERIKRSPDNADAVLLAYCNLGTIVEQVAGNIQVPQ